MASWREAFDTYRQPRLLAILFMGFSSGLPYALTGGTLSFWLAQSGVSRTAIGLFALIGIAYIVKFVWSPVIDRLPIPGLTRRLGRRRSWALLIQVLLVPAIVVLGLTDPTSAPFRTALVALVVAFLSASQDIVIDAYRIELLTPKEQPAGASATQWGYRFGLIAGGAGALYASAFGGWLFSYTVMAALMGIGMTTIWLTPEPPAPPILPPAGDSAGARLRAWLSGAVVAPLSDFAGRPYWVAILVFVVLYFLPEALAGRMANPLYVSLGFTAVEVANISKVFGVFATMFGVALGGLVMARIGVYPSLLFCGIAQTLSNLLYAVLARAGHDLAILTLSITGENVTLGMGQAAFVAYLSRLCNVNFTATQYALLSSLAAVARILLSAPAGWFADQFDWVTFFVLATATGAPGLLVLLWLMRRNTLEPATQPSAAR